VEVNNTPGLGVTNKSLGKMLDELKELERYAKIGVSSILLVVPKGRLTHEQESACSAVWTSSGEDAVQHMVVAVT